MEVIAAIRAVLAEETAMKEGEGSGVRTDFTAP